MTREEAKTLADRVLALSKAADQTRVNITSTWGGNTRFADASITTSGGITDVVVDVTVTIGRRRASASTNVLDDASLRRTVDLAAQLARLSPDDPELMPELGPQTVCDRERVHRRHGQSDAGGSRRRGAPHHRRHGRRPDLFGGISRRPRHRCRGRDQQRLVRVSPHDRCRSVHDGEDAGRHGQRLGQRRIARLGTRSTPRLSAERPRAKPNRAGTRRQSTHGQ